MSPTNSDMLMQDRPVNHITKLRNAAGYRVWEFTMKLYLKKEDEWKVVSGESRKPQPVNATEISGAEVELIEEWEAVDESARFHIATTLHNDVVTHIINCTTAKQMWDKIATVFKPKSASALAMLIERLCTTRYKEGDSLQNHLAEMENIVAELANMDEIIPDHHVAIFILRSLPSSWDTLVFIMNGEASGKLKSKDVIERILEEHERRLGSTPAQPPKRAIGALSARDKGSRKDLSHIECYSCGKKGHYSRDCKSKNKKPEEARSAQESFTLLAEDVAEDSGALLSRRVDNAEEWIVDSGAAHHFTGRLDALANFVSAPIAITTASGGVVTSPGHGRAKLVLGDGKGIDLPRVHYLPGATMGLLSVSAITDAGGHVTFNKERVATITKKGKLVAKTIPGSNYRLDAKLIKLEDTAASAREATSGSLMQWHRRLGHISLDAILELERKGMVNGLVLTDRKREDCEACIYAKSNRSPFKAVSTVPPHALYRVFLDLGFVDVPDRNGCQIYLAIVDQFTTAKWSFALKSKDADVVLGVWRDWKRQVETQTNEKIRRVRTDNGGEFVNDKFRKALEDDGIVHERTAPYTPEQNGQVERLNGSLMSKTRALLKDSQLPKAFWSDALHVATFVSNRTTHPRLDGKTAYEAFTGNKPYVGHLRPFGAIGYIHKDIRKKLDDTAVKGFLVGYDGSDSGYNYRMWLPEEERVVITRHVTFGRQEEPELDVSEETEVILINENVRPPPQLAEKEVQIPPAEPEPDVPARQKKRPGYDYQLVPNQYVPGRFEEVDENNIMAGKRTRSGAHLASHSLSESIYVCLAKVHDERPADGIWEEESIFVGVALPDIPRNYQEAMASPERRRWEEAMEKEWEAFEMNGVLERAKLPRGARALGTTWVYTRKTDAAGNVIRHKARLVAQGFAQRPGIDVNETFAPVSRMSTVRTVIALTALKGLVLQQFDFDTAFLNGKMTEDVYIKVPFGYPGKHEPGDVLKLVRAMYGTKQAPREWHRAADALMIAQGFKKSTSDACLYTREDKEGLVVVVLYVDDGLIAAPNRQVAESVIEGLRRTYNLKSMDDARVFLSIELARTKEGIMIHQSKYIRSILERYGFDTLSRHSASTPMEDRTSRDDSSPFYADIQHYQSAVGSLQYAAQLSRPDIAAAVRAVAQHVTAPIEEDWIAVKRIFRYLARTQDYGIAYRRGTSSEIVAYSDASWADDPETRRSVGAYAVILAGGVVSWRSKQQTLVATSTTESETLAASEAAKEVLCFRQLAKDLGISQPSCTTIFEDNTACIAIANDPKFQGRTKHFDVGHKFVAERIKMGDIRLQYCPTNDMTADVLTKALAKGKFEHHRNGLGMVSLVCWTSGSVADGVGATNATNGTG